MFQPIFPNSDRFLRGSPAAEAKRAERLNAGMDSAAAVRDFVARNVFLDAPHVSVTEHFFAEVIQSGEVNSSDEDTGKARHYLGSVVSDSRVNFYYVRRKGPKLSLENDVLLEVEDDDAEPKELRVVRASNLAEHVTQTHAVRENVGILVHVYSVVVDTADGSAKHYFFYHEPGPIPAKITGSTQDGSNKRWEYTATQVFKTSAGYEGWGTEGDRLTTTFTCYNTAEDGNDSSSSAEALLDNTIVFLVPVFIDEGNEVEWWFTGGAGSSTAHALFPVSLTTDGGTNGTGNPLTTADLTFAVTDYETGESYGAGLSPVCPPQMPGPVTATLGEGYRDSGGDFVLWRAHYVWGGGGCV